MARSSLHCISCCIVKLESSIQGPWNKGGRGENAHPQIFKEINNVRYLNREMADYAPHIITYSPPGFSDLPPSLPLQYFKVNTHIQEASNITYMCIIVTKKHIPVFPRMSHAFLCTRTSRAVGRSKNREGGGEQN